MVQPKPDLPSRPYLVGLTGGLASGKSSICEYLKTLGAGVIDCDKVAHELYKPKTDLYFKLIELFGENILSENGDVDRKQLGALVFNDLVSKISTLKSTQYQNSNTHFQSIFFQ